MSQQDGKKLHFNSKYELNEQKFDSVDTEEKAYWLGFLAADGNIYSERNLLQINLAIVDNNHLYKFRSFLESTHPVVITKAGDSRLAINNKYLCNALKNLGVVDKKSFTVKPWLGIKTLQRHYWRGYFDGNGWCHKKNDGTYEFGVSSASCDLIDGYCKFVKEDVGLKTRVTTDGTAAYRVRIGGVGKPQILAKFLYENAVIFLDRKRDNIDNLNSLIPKRKRLASW